MIFVHDKMIDTTLRTVADLKPGESGTIVGFLEPELASKLLDMGCLPGEVVRMKFFAPLGDPLCIRVDGFDLSIRKEEARTITIK